MPTKMRVPSIGELEVATEEELLAFANQVRQAGGAETIPALLPSQYQNPSACLIANAVNFKSEINTRGDTHDRWPNGGFRWYMFISGGKGNDKIKKIANELNLATRWLSEPVAPCWPGELGMVLPAPIGNAAHAFDNGIAFTEYGF